MDVCTGGLVLADWRSLLKRGERGRAAVSIAASVKVVQPTARGSLGVLMVAREYSVCPLPQLQHLATIITAITHRKRDFDRVRQGAEDAG